MEHSPSSLLWIKISISDRTATKERAKIGEILNLKIRRLRSEGCCSGCCVWNTVNKASLLDCLLLIRAIRFITKRLRKNTAASLELWCWWSTIVLLERLLVSVAWNGHDVPVGSASIRPKGDRSRCYTLVHVHFGQPSSWTYGLHHIGEFIHAKRTISY